ncbi:hypothetical protein [Treponema sp.]|uniref:hypothetical protein n=1 Tax=Treponema sp. TaxID=166 RepID=UPI00298E72BA|nr:hypothetical protein [Treponema sp.]
MNSIIYIEIDVHKNSYSYCAYAKEKTVFSQNIKVKLVQRMQSITLNPLLKQPALISPSLLVMKLDLPVINFAEIYKKLAFPAL